MNYYTQVDWDLNLIDLYTTDIDNPLVKGLVFRAIQIVTGAPTATVGKFMPGAKIYNAADGTEYINSGTTAAPVWSLVPTSVNAFSLPTTETDSTTTTGTSLSFIQNLITTGKGFVQSLTALTTGIGHQIIAAAATLTTGRYYSANDSAVEVFGVGANGHLHTAQTTPPTIAVTAQNGITAAAITAGGADTAHIITTTGTNNNGGATVLQVTFGKTYTTAPKSVSLTARNASGAGPNPPFVSAITATTYDITIPASASAGATPSWNAVVIA